MQFVIVVRFPKGLTGGGKSILRYMFAFSMGLWRGNKFDGFTLLIWEGLSKEASGTIDIKVSINSCLPAESTILSNLANW